MRQAQGRMRSAEKGKLKCARLRFGRVRFTLYIATANCCFTKGNFPLSLSAAGAAARGARWQNIIWQKGKLARECRKDVVLLVPGDIARDGVVNSELTSAASGAARAPAALCLRWGAP